MPVLPLARVSIYTLDESTGFGATGRLDHHFAFAPLVVGIVASVVVCAATDTVVGAGRRKRTQLQVDLEKGLKVRMSRRRRSQPRHTQRDWLPAVAKPVAGGA